MIAPCCCDGDPCTYAEDKFTRANETPLASPWSKLSGTDWNLTSNHIEAVAAGHYKHTTAFPGSSSDYRTAVVDAVVAVGAVEVQTGLTDKDNYYAARLIYSASGCVTQLAAMFVSGGIATTCTPGPSITSCVQVWGLSPGDNVRIRVCLLPNTGSYGYATYDTVIATIYFLDDPTRIPISCTLLADGPAVGAYSGLKTTMATTLDNFKASYYRNSPSGEHRTCPWCHTACAISQDDFSYDEPCLWDVRSGSYSVSGGLFTITSTGIIQHHIFHPGLKTTHKVTVDVQDNGVESKVYIGNGYAKLTYSAGLRTLTLYNNSNVVLDTDVQTVAVTADATKYMALTLCYSRGVLSCTVTGRGSSLCVDSSIAETDLAYWASLGGNNGAVFDNFVFSKTYDATAPSDEACDTCGTCHEPCSQCKDGTNADFFKIVLPSSPAPCFFCNDIFDGSFVTEHDGDPCVKEHRTTDTSCHPCLAAPAVSIQIMAPGTPDWNSIGLPSTSYKIRVTLYESDDIFPCGGAGAHPWNYIIWEKDYGTTKPDCLNLVDEEIPWLESNISELPGHSGAAGGCNGTDFGPAFVTSL